MSEHGFSETLLGMLKFEICVIFMSQKVVPLIFSHPPKCKNGLYGNVAIVCQRS